MDSTPGGSLNDFFRSPYSQEDLQRQVAQRRRNAPLRTASMATVHPASTPIGQDTMDMSGMAGIMGGDTLDDIIMQNNKELQRRQSLPQGYLPQDTDRRASMMEFGSGNPHLNGYSFGPPTTASGDSHGHMRRQSSSELDMGGGYNEMAPGMGVAGQQMGYTTSMEGREPLSINTDAPFSAMSTEMMQNLMSYTPMGIDGMDGMDGDDQNLNTFSPQSFSQLYGTAGLDPNDFMMASSISNALPHNENMQSADGAPDDIGPNMPGLGMSENAITNSPTNMNMNQNNMGLFHSPIPNPRPLVIQDPSFGASVPALAAPAPDIEVVGAPLPEPPPKYSGIYSSSGFDMLGALMKVATRKNPEINIGKVDMSCAFVVCDMSLHDCPIIYVSDIFERLTGYNKYEVKGQNCRFLQSPEGKVEAQSKREFVDNDSVYYLKNRIEDKKEAQRSLINYRKGGQPFMNLLTMIPITGEDDKELKYFVGFQVDLVEKPHSVEGKNGSGLYTVDYSQGMLPRYVWQPPEGVRPLDGGQTISRDDVSTVLNSVNSSGETELTKRMWDKVLLENTDDVVHVLSLKGLFLYLSPSSRRVLEYDASELVGTALSSVCHPSDIVPVTRELKDTSTGAAVNVVFRIRRKKSGYTWFESHGTLCVEQGKGRKCIILVGRERPVYALHRHEVDATGGIGESEMWTKISTSGMFLFVSSNVRTLLDRSPDDLVGTSIQSLMRSESRVGFGRSLEKARTGKRVTHKHEILNKRGLVLQAQTTLYPGDASEGQKPTFLVAQTRLLKSSSRAVAPALGSNASASSESPVGRASEAKESTTLGHPSSLSSTGVSTETTTVATVNSMGNAVTQAGGSGLPIGSQDVALASEDNIFDELKTTRCTSWQFELRQMEKSNRLLAEELAALLSSKKKRKRRKGSGNPQRDCANCHVKVTPEWRRGPSGQRDLCNSCGLRWAKQTGRVSPRTSTRGGDTASKTSQTSSSPVHSSPLQQEVTQDRQSLSSNPNLNTDKEGKGNMKGEGAAVPASLGGRSTADSMPVHLPSQGFREGGERRITNIDEGNEMVT